MPADTAPAWPDPARPGVPMNPERDGAHWIIGWNNSPFVAEWQADPNAEFGGDYGWYDGGDRPDGIIANGWTYGGPCHTPAEVADGLARVRAAAWAAGAAAMREMATEFLRATAREIRNKIPESFSSLQTAACRTVADTLDETEVAIRALPLPPMPGTTQGGNADE